MADKLTKPSSLLLLELAQRFFQGVSCLFLLLLGIDLYQQAYRIEVSFTEIANAEKIPKKDPAQNFSRKPLSYYTAQLSRADFFKGGVTELSFTVSGYNGFENQQASFSDVLKNWSINGVVMGDNPAVFIYDKETQKTTLLKQGQLFEGFLIKEIHKNGLTLQKGEEKYSFNF